MYRADPLAYDTILWDAGVGVQDGHAPTAPVLVGLAPAAGEDRRNKRAFAAGFRFR
jgi:hypothetical protein